MTPDNQPSNSAKDTQPAGLGRGVDTKLAHALFSSKYATVIGLFVGLAAVLLAAAFLKPTLQGPLVALSAVSVFSSLLLYLVTPERFLAADVAASIASVASQNTALLVERAGVNPTPRYVPTDSGVKLFFPGQGTDTTPPASALTGAGTEIDQADGLVLEPTGTELLGSAGFQTSKLPTDAEEALVILSPVIVNQFGLADRATIESVDDQHVTLRVSGTVFHTEHTCDDPVQSILSVGLATALDAPVQPAMTVDENDDLLITLQWGEALTAK